MSDSQLEYVVIIGGGKSQFPFITAASALGYGTVVLDRDHSCPGRQASNRFYAVSTRDTEKLLSLTLGLDKELKIAGVMTYSAAEETLRVVATICETLGFPSFSRLSLDRVIDKGKMKNRLLEMQVPTAEWLLTNDKALVLDFFHRMKAPVVVKPSKGAQGSTGVSLIKDETELSAQIQSAISASSDDLVVVEEFIKGREYSVDGIISKGKPITMALSEKGGLGSEQGFVMSGFSMVETGYEMSPRIAAIEKLAHQAVLALELDHSLFTVDIIDSGDAIVVVECGVLLDCKIDRLLYHAGIELYKEYIQLITGCYKTKNYGCSLPLLQLRFLFSRQSGRLTEKSGSELPGLIVEWEREVGDSVRIPTSIADTVGWVIGNAKDISVFEKSKIAPFEVV